MLYGRSHLVQGEMAPQRSRETSPATIAQRCSRPSMFLTDVAEWLGTDLISVLGRSFGDTGSRGSVLARPSWFML
jgi:hypothetical protein